MDIRSYNRKAWDKNVESQNEWTLPVSSEEVEAARTGNWSVVLTPIRPVPGYWFPTPLQNKKILCLASGGGQQGPILAAAGAQVTIFDNSPKQLAQDRLVADRDGLQLQTVEGDMSDLSIFPDESFDLVFHPVSNLFVPDVLPVWKEAFRVLRHSGSLLAGFMNPAFYLFDRDQMDDHDILQVTNVIPYSDIKQLSPESLQRIMDNEWPLEFGHTLENQIGGQIQAGFVITGFYEDRDPRSVLDEHMPIFIATKATKV